MPEIIGLEPVCCQRCGSQVKSFSQMRKWCHDCRKSVSSEQARERKLQSSSVLDNV